MFVPYNGKFKIRQAYKGQKHKGLDFVGLDNKNIVVPEDSSLIIEFVGWDPHPTGGMGLFIVGRRVKDGLYAYFAHLSKTYVSVGDYARPGNLLGIEGSTGHSTGSHLHYEVRKKRGDNTSFIDVSQLCGIPNEMGTYEVEEEEEMVDFEKLTDAQVDSLVKRIYKRLGEEPVSEYAEEASKKAVESGVFSDGDKDGMVDNPQGFMKRQELAVVLVRSGIIK